MTIRNHALTMARDNRGFSMIDVLVAIVVLATGLLALAALQGALTRNGADARARSQVAAYTESLIDRMRFAGYDAVAPSTAIAQGDTITPSSSCSGALTLLQRMKCDADAAQTAAGISNLKTEFTVAQLYCGTSGSTFSAGTACTSGAANYKQIQAVSTWVDASGQQRSLTLDTAVSPITVATGDNTLDNTFFAADTGNSPVVRQSNPSNTLGVIPIAVSDTSDAAATNPKPVITNTGTTFSTLTYVATASSYGGNQIQSRVDEKIIQCSCAFGGPSTTDSNLTAIFAQPYGPTYWDGTHYTSPLQTPNTTSSTTGVNSSATQDPSCDICCRDRNDGVGNLDALGNAISFDNYTGNGTKKYRYVSGVPTEETSGTFQQACRMIRVDGTYMASTDAHLNFFSLLATDNCASQTSSGHTAAPTGCTSSLDASDTVPSDTTETTYGNFVKEYLFQNFTNLSTNGVPSITESSPQLTDTYASLYKGSPYNLNLPTNITINLPNTVSRWVYARGIYVDHLEAQARTMLTNAIANCSSQTDHDIVEDCALPILPFTTVNMTELANWGPSTSGIVNISNTAIIGGDESSPKRGNVTVPSTQSGSGDPTVNAVATAYLTNSGLTAVSTQQANSTYDTGNSSTDQRQFTVSGSGSSGGGVYFDVALSGLSWMSTTSSSNLVPSVAWSGTDGQLGAAASGTSNAYSTATTSGSGKNQTTTYTWLYGGSSSTLPIPVAATNTPPVGLTVTVQNYNSTDTGGSASNVTCTNSSTGTTTTGNSFTGLTRCLNYQVDYANITIGGTNAAVPVGNVAYSDNGGKAEIATITLPSTPGISSTTNTIAGASALIIPFTLEGTTTPSGTCSASTSCNSQGKNCTTINTYTQTSCPN